MLTWEELAKPNSQYIYWSKVPYLVLDFEATSRNVLDSNAELVLACWTIVLPDGTTESKYKFGDEYSQKELLADLKKVRFVVAQNAKYDLQWLKRCGVELRDVLVYCTMLAAWVIDGNQSLPRNLDALAVRYKQPRKIDLIKKYWECDLTTFDIPPSWLLSYCQQDVATTHGVFLEQRKEVKELNLEHIVYLRNLTCAALADIEFAGMTLDPKRVAEEYERVTKGLEETELILHELTGGINLNSPKQLREFLFEELGFDPPRDHRGNIIKTPTGGISTKADHLDKLTAENDKQRQFLDVYKSYNKLTSLLQKNLSFFLGVVKERNCVFNAVFNQGITKTHRLSSSGIPLRFTGEKSSKSVQFQNLPREYKRLFWSGDEEYLIGEADGAQLEFRVAADLGEDEIAISEISNDVDIHSVTAKTLTEAGQPTDRQGAKQYSFKPLYGGSAGTKAVQDYCKFFTNKYKGISGTQRAWALEVVNNKYLVTPYGMRFYWPDTRMDRGGYIKNTTSIYNFPIQGLATGEIIPIALVAFWYEIRDRAITILNTIHDSIVAKVACDSVEWYEETVRRCLTDEVFKFLRDVYKYEFVTNLGCGIKLSPNWGDTKREVIYNVSQDGTYNRRVKE